MSRSLGDNLSKGIGVTHEPEVVELEIEAEDKFVILGSDGVWESITSTQVLNFLVPLFNQGKMEQCCDTLLQLCLSSSLTKPLDPIDDITFILIFLNKPG
jgi:serine/threonine protein phosphatase PrpC